MRAALVVLAALAASAPARAARAEPAPDTPTLTWDPAWARAGVGDYVLIGAAGATTLAAVIAQPVPEHRRGGLLLDDEVRRALRLPTLGARYAARDVSDVFLSLAVTWPIFIDAALTAGWQRKSPEVAYQMAVIDAEAMAIAGAVQGVTNVLVSRERPYGRDCGNELPTDVRDCNGPQRFRSFFSGHAALTFTSAGLVCSHHLHLHLYGGAGDVLACAAGYSLAAATSALRVAGDMHYATDVLTGAAVGTVVGLAVPAFHYARRSPALPAPGGLELRVVPAAAGVGVLGVF